ncbi:hypothetical protein HMPREF1991_01710 [Hoylesella loescheii DSM 19665 = JCM 12249 = ATCC 15930]|uniref:Uncharacterized protein n=1 Tax=Hoylesella loescheii DSM 19665 = JCM 12249 = ATCC 15930 TaxID=1122985 RepID=A0A069QHM9_HOYLO|nr:hypothetical protein HMPREF1991_01710 [Hoylesella loescheii DSM 19665 = JCM 12249 = ATCC 15930]
MVVNEMAHTHSLVVTKLIVISNKRIIWPIKPLRLIFSLHVIDTCQSNLLTLVNPITILSCSF